MYKKNRWRKEKPIDTKTIDLIICDLYRSDLPTYPSACEVTLAVEYAKKCKKYLKYKKHKNDKSKTHN